MQQLKHGDEGYGAALAQLLARGARGIGDRFTIRKKRRWVDPHQGARECARRQRQMERGTLTAANRGVVNANVREEAGA